MQEKYRGMKHETGIRHYAPTEGVGICGYLTAIIDNNYRPVVIVVALVLAHCTV